MDDLISRKALLEAYDKAHQGPPGGARKLIEEAPEAIVRCKDCAKYDRNTGICSDGIKRGCAETWFCADGKPKNKQLDYADKDTAYYADTPVMMPAT